MTVMGMGKKMFFFVVKSRWNFDKILKRLGEKICQKLVQKVHKNWNKNESKFKYKLATTSSKDSFYQNFHSPLSLYIVILQTFSCTKFESAGSSFLW